jgi:glycine/D-amino acid oxidase-like deaminating enzyme
MFVKRLKSIEFGVGRSFFTGPEALGSWRLDQVSPFERTRVLHPVPDLRTVDNTLTRARALYPALAEVGVAEAWGAYVDSTPDDVPVISPIDALPGLHGASTARFGSALGHVAAGSAVPRS